MLQKLETKERGTEIFGGGKKTTVSNHTHALVFFPFPFTPIPKTLLQKQKEHRKLEERKSRVIQQQVPHCNY